MSNFSNLIIFGACFGLGYLIEPSLFPSGEEKPETEATAEAQDISPTAAPANSSVTIDMDISQVSPEDFPEKIEILKPLSIHDETSGVKLQLEKGTFVKPVRIKGDLLIVQPLGIPIDTEISVNDTNFKQLALPKMLSRLQKVASTPKVVTNTAPTTPVPIPFAEVPPTVVEVPPTVVETPPTVVEVPPVVVETPPAVSETVNSTPLTEEIIIAKMKASILAGEVKEFTPQQITSVKKGNPVTINGVVYENTGQIVFEAMTILGKQTHGAIALFRGDKVEKWVWARNMLQMR